MIQCTQSVLLCGYYERYKVIYQSSENISRRKKRNHELLIHISVYVNLFKGNISIVTWIFIMKYVDVGET